MKRRATYLPVIMLGLFVSGCRDLNETKIQLDLTRQITAGLEKEALWDIHRQMPPPSDFEMLLTPDPETKRFSEMSIYSLQQDIKDSIKVMGADRDYHKLGFYPDKNIDLDRSDVSTVNFYFRVKIDQQRLGKEIVPSQWDDLWEIVMLKRQALGDRIPNNLTPPWRDARKITAYNENLRNAHGWGDSKPQPH